MAEEVEGRPLAGEQGAGRAADERDVDRDVVAPVALGGEPLETPRAPPGEKTSAATSSPKTTPGSFWTIRALAPGVRRDRSPRR